MQELTIIYKPLFKARLLLIRPKEYYTVPLQKALITLPRGEFRGSQGLR